MTDEHYMKLALKEAQKAYDEGEVPVGAVVVLNEKVIARGYNMVEKLNDPTAHAEMIALTSAFNFLGSKYLPDATLYVTVEPCLMCAGALYWSKIGKVVWGADDEKNGHRLTPRPPLHHVERGSWPFHPKTEIVMGVLKNECAALMKAFFQSRR
ncbi:MAG: nucleoside deaminase [Chitinophagaceae bacterium]|nr:nucleoside deaminase [Chitinophagaceae bacterium]